MIMANSKAYGLHSWWHKSRQCIHSKCGYASSIGITVVVRQEKDNVNKSPISLPRLEQPGKSPKQTSELSVAKWTLHWILLLYIQSERESIVAQLVAECIKCYIVGYCTGCTSDLVADNVYTSFFYHHYIQLYTSSSRYRPG